ASHRASTVNQPANPPIATLSLHDALPIWITADAALPEIFPLTVAGARGRGELATLSVPAALTRKWPSLTSLEGAPAFNEAGERRSEEHTSELQSRGHLVCRLLLEKKN